MYAHLCLNTDWFSIPVCEIDVIWHSTRSTCSASQLQMPEDLADPSAPNSTQPLFLTWRKRDSPAEAIFLYGGVIQKTGLIKSINRNALLLPALQRPFFLHSFSPLVSPVFPADTAVKGGQKHYFFRAPIRSFSFLVKPLPAQLSLS